MDLFIDGYFRFLCICILRRLVQIGRCCGWSLHFFSLFSPQTTCRFVLVIFRCDPIVVAAHSCVGDLNTQRLGCLETNSLYVLACIMCLEWICLQNMYMWSVLRHPWFIFCQCSDSFTPGAYCIVLSSWPWDTECISIYLVLYLMVVYSKCPKISPKSSILYRQIIVISYNFWHRDLRFSYRLSSTLPSKG